MKQILLKQEPIKIGICLSRLVKVIQAYSFRLFTVDNGELVDESGKKYTPKEVEKLNATPVLDHDKMVMYMAYFLSTNDFNFGYLLSNIHWLDDDVTEFMTEIKTKK